MSNLDYYYLAGFYTIEETLDKSLEIAGVIQTQFNPYAMDWNLKLEKNW